MKKESGFSLLEVLIALGIASLFLAVLLRLELSSAKIIANTSLGFETLNLAVENLEKLKNETIIGEEKFKKDNFIINAKKINEPIQDLNISKLNLSIELNQEIIQELSWYYFK